MKKSYVYYLADIDRMFVWDALPIEHADDDIYGVYVGPAGELELLIYDYVIYLGEL
jgi:hypothetical protein